MGNLVNKDIVDVLSPNRVDGLASTLKAISNAVPLAGGALSEIISNCIPKQRLDRVVEFLKNLSSKVDSLEDKLNEHKKDPIFCEMIYEATRQAAYSTSEERRKYLSSIVVEGLNEYDIGFIESRKILDILGQLSDIEIMWLKYYENPPTLGGNNPFFEKHKQLFAPVAVTMNASKSEREKAAIQSSYKQTLLQHGLLEEVVKVDSNKSISRSRSTMSNYRITEFGRMFLSRIGFDEN